MQIEFHLGEAQIVLDEIPHVIPPYQARAKVTVESLISNYLCMILNIERAHIRLCHMMGVEHKNSDEITDSRSLLIRIVGGFRVRIFGKTIEWYPIAACRNVADLKSLVIKTLRSSGKDGITAEMLLVIYKD